MPANPYIFPIYKPKGPSSFFIIKQLRVITGIKKIGHAGTLDPLADGVLVVGITRVGTKQLDSLIRKDKAYSAEVILGVTTITHDAEGEKDVVKVDQPPSLADIQAILPQFIGEITQTPPRFSAVKIKGQPAYKRARAGEEFEIKPKQVLIKGIKILEYQYPRLVLDIETGSGVYIRALARDLGKVLKTGAYLGGLTRTRVGQFTLDQALTVDEFKRFWSKQHLI